MRSKLKIMLVVDNVVEHMVVKIVATTYVAPANFTVDHSGHITSPTLFNPGFTCKFVEIYALTTSQDFLTKFSTVFRLIYVLKRASLRPK